MRRVLVIEPDQAARRELLLGLREHAIEAEGVATAEAAGPTLAAGRVDVLLLGDGVGPILEVLLSVAVSPSPVHLVALVKGDSTEGLSAIRQGATDFVLAGAGIDALVLALRKIEARAASVQNAGRGLGVADARVPDAGTEQAGASGSAARPVFVGNSPKIAAMLAMVRRLAGVKAAVLIGGESGTGKELVAQALHDQSPWRQGPFVAVNCGAIPAGLIESELFGHVRGSFTDAVRDKQGLFEAAHGGTLFLDEIADLPLGLQSKLLRVVQDGVMRRVGDVGDKRVEVRVVAATARDLSAEVRAGRFREDLYYRLAALIIQIPALRERPEDIPLLARHFLRRSRVRLGLPANDIEPAALRLLCAYAWPGNVRELENTIERAAVLSVGDNVDVAGLPERLVPPGSSPMSGPSAIDDDRPVDPNDLSIKRASSRAEQSLIRRALAATGGNRTRAALLLEISHRALLYKMKDYGIVVGRGKSSEPDGLEEPEKLED